MQNVTKVIHWNTLSSLGLEYLLICWLTTLVVIWPQQINWKTTLIVIKKCVLLPLILLDTAFWFLPCYGVGGQADYTPPPSLIFLLWSFWWNHLQTIHNYRSYAKVDSQKFKIEDFIAIWNIWRKKLRPIFGK